MSNNDPAQTAPVQTKRVDQTASRAGIALYAGIALLVACIVYSSIADLRWLSWVLARGWLVAIAVFVISLLALLLFDLTRSKNVAWRLLLQEYGKSFGAESDRRNFGTGSGKIGDQSYFGLRCFGTPDGLEICRLISFVNPPLYLPWSAVAKIDTFPNLLTGRKEFETDMQAQIILRDQPELTIEVPWLTEYRQLLPKSIKYRAIKLSKK